MQQATSSINILQIQRDATGSCLHTVSIAATIISKKSKFLSASNFLQKSSFKSLYIKAK